MKHTKKFTIRKNVTGLVGTGKGIGLNNGALHIFQWKQEITLLCMLQWESLILMLFHVFFRD
jgi:hypothetical protein